MDNKKWICYDKKRAKEVFPMEDETMKINKYVMMMLVIGLIINSSACGNNGNGNNTEMINPTEVVQETESEFYIEIADAADILLKVWDSYATEERFDIMGGHFTAGVIGEPAKYDLTQATDLVQMYCVPEVYMSMIDDAATMVDLYNAARFTAGVYHVTNVEEQEAFIKGISEQIESNSWHGETPEKVIVLKVGEEYVVAIYGRETLVNQFKQKLEAIYQTMIEVVVENTIS